MKRKVLGLNLKDKIRNEKLRKGNGKEDASKNARTLKWR